MLYSKLRIIIILYSARLINKHLMYALIKNTYYRKHKHVTVIIVN